MGGLVNMFGKRDGVKEFEQMRQALKPAERFAMQPKDGETTSVEAKIGLTPGPVERGASPVVSPAPKAFVIPSEPNSSVVSLGSSWQGNLKIDGSVRIEGEVTGEVDAKDTVYVAESARVDAKVRAAIVVIAGEFKGEVHCSERLEITPSGRVNGELTTKSLTVSEGAFIEGQIHMTNGRPVDLAPLPPARKQDVPARLLPDKTPVSVVADRPSTI
jgi:cytoskeletal protein CcmA (bactofilin family)